MRRFQRPAVIGGDDAVTRAMRAVIKRKSMPSRSSPAARRIGTASLSRAFLDKTRRMPTQGGRRRRRGRRSSSRAPLSAASTSASVNCRAFASTDPQLVTKYSPGASPKNLKRPRSSVMSRRAIRCQDLCRPFQPPLLKAMAIGAAGWPSSVMILPEIDPPGTSRIATSEIFWLSASTMARPVGPHDAHRQRRRDRAACSRRWCSGRPGGSST